MARNEPRQPDVSVARPQRAPPRARRRTRCYGARHPGNGFVAAADARPTTSGAQRLPPWRAPRAGDANRRFQLASSRCARAVVYGLVVGGPTAADRPRHALTYRSNRIINFAHADTARRPSCSCSSCTRCGWPLLLATAAGVAGAPPPAPSSARDHPPFFHAPRRSSRSPRSFSPTWRQPASSCREGVRPAPPPRPAAAELPRRPELRAGGIIFNGGDVQTAIVVPSPCSRSASSSSAAPPVWPSAPPPTAPTRQPPRRPGQAPANRRVGVASLLAFTAIYLRAAQVGFR